jgi:hypothetical protein
MRQREKIRDQGSGVSAVEDEVMPMGEGER